MAKGPAYEREICKQLSKWWTDGQRDDVFWRSVTSGARATTRARVGEDTFGQHGDVQATDPIGQPFVDLVTVEIKRGYKGASIADMLDAPKRAARQMWERWYVQVRDAQRQAGTPFWMLITRRDRRRAVVFVERRLDRMLTDAGAMLYQTRPRMMFQPRLKYDSQLVVVAYTLDNFLEWVKPGHIQAVLERCRDGK